MKPSTLPWTDQLSAWSTFATAVLTILLLVVAVWAAYIAIKTMKASQDASIAALEANEQARRDSIEQTRPYVFVEIVPSLVGTGSYDIRVANVGKSSARDLTMSFSNWPEKMDDVAEKVKTLFDKPRTLPPRCSIRSIWRLTGNFTDGTKEAGSTDHGTITVYYTSDDPSKPEYIDEFDFDIENAGLWPVADAGPDAVGLDKNVRPFYRLGQTIAKHLGELYR